ncbi:glycosyltransferase [Cytobacillus purgationiresistens]|uniref:Glycosyltransferase involved in cell wall biosynthesis n=1 Tax=Cytobacillus purgationiresistens TaxID=863449 RepID=A0ABU0AI62_9BACI|nr:glycosyltransferase involved in cell wall biosynthesis [Cytobacillus purgationiresistens]
MITISLCMIVKDEEEVLHQCLSSIVDICDEIIIVDTGSSDKTKEIAEQFTSNLFDFEWIDDFAAARNFAFSKANMEYILWLDGDDLLLHADQTKLKALKENLSNDVDAVTMLYHLAFDEFGHSTFSSRRHRLVRKDREFKWIGPVHEYLEVGGNIIQSDIVIQHRKSNKTNDNVQSDRNIKIYEKRLEKGEEFSPRDLFYYANELKDHQQFDKAVLYYVEFLLTKKGWVEDEVRSCINLASCYRNLGDEEKVHEALVLSLKYDVPRPEVSCQLGDIYKEKNMYKKAIIWYKLAVEVDIDDTLGFKQEIYSTWYPHLQLCYCYWQIGEQELSIKHNSIAKKFRPDDSRIIYNDQFYNEYFKSENYNE